MHRRTLFTLAGAAPLALPRLEAIQSRPSGRLKIAAVEFWRLEGRREIVAGVTGQHQVQPLHVYDEYRPKPFHEGTPAKRTVDARALYLKIKTDAGLEGVYGPIDTEAAIVVDQQLRRFLIGKDPLAVEALWDQMHRSNRHSRRGIFMMAISAVDNALWDLRGRYFEAPVYRLLGGPTRRDVEAYASCLGYSVEPEPARARAIEIKKQGYRHQKWFCAYGPGDGAAGLMKNVELVRVLREAVGPETELMIDAFNGWNLDYAIAWAKQVEQYRPRWIEEAFVSEKIDSFAALRKATSVPVATGEHLYGRWEVNEFLRAGAISVVQADPEWCGGVSELVKICAVASIYDAQVIPHGHAMHTPLHVVAAQSPMTCPLVEFLVTKMTDNYYYFEKNQPTPVAGRIALPDRPGFGIEFDPARVEKQTQAK
ncbi:MAG: enolase C-terminal domain-like protein [Bryobacterales bacterium]|nr:enolase C-terminal domain-like protein [Bryobacterales bacterium]